MAPIKPRTEENEIGPDAMEPVALFIQPEVESTSRPVNEGKNEVETDVAGKRNFMVSLWESLVGVKNFVEEKWLKHFSGGRIDRTRAYQVWPGNNVLSFISCQFHCCNQFLKTFFFPSFNRNGILKNFTHNFSISPSIVRR